MIKIVIIDSQKDFRDSIANLLAVQHDFVVLGVGKDAYDALKLVEALKPDVVLLELDLPMINAIKLCPSIKLRSSGTAIIILTKENNNDETILQMISSGASACLLRSSVLDEISIAVRSVHKNDYHMSREIMSRVIYLFSELIRGRGTYGATAHFEPIKHIDPILINRIEMKIVACVGQGLSNKEIAGKLKLKEGTVRNYVSLILQKTGLEHRTQIAIYAFNNGFVAQEDCVKRETKPAKRKRTMTVQFRRNSSQIELVKETSSESKCEGNQELAY
jgi:DNA-binding NarL/FixJ family response regulator